MEMSVKQHVKKLLINREHNLLVDFCEKDKRYWQEVRFRLYDIDEKIRWPAIETVARLMERWWRKGQEERVRNYIRTLFWSMTDESGGIGWSSPQTVAEIIAVIPALIDPYGSMMIAHTIDEPPLVKGCLWGIGRLGKLISDSVYFFKDKVFSVFQSEDVETLGLAAWAMGEVRFEPSLPLLKKLLHHEESLSIYISGEFKIKSLREWSLEAIAKIKEILS